MLLNTPAGDLGWKAPEFSLPDLEGNQVSLESVIGPNGLMVAFICNHCPYVKAVVDRMTRDFAELQAKGIGVVAIMSNDYRLVEADSPDNMARFSKKHGFTFPYLLDERQSVGKAYGAVCTPDFFGFNSDGELQYRGRLDDARMGPSDGRKRELVDAMIEIAKSGKGPAAQFASIGCSIKWSRRG